MDANSLKDRIVVGYDGSEAATAALQWARGWAEDRGIGLGVITAIGPSPASFGIIDGSFYEGIFERAEAFQKKAVDKIQAEHPDTDVVTLLSEHAPAHALVEASRHAAAVVVGTKGRGPNRELLLGGVADAITQHAHGPVVVVPADMFFGKFAGGDIVVGFDDTPACLPPLRFALEQAQHWKAKLRLVHGWKGEFRWMAGRGEDLPRSVVLANFEADVLSRLQHFANPVLAEFPDVETEWVVEQSFPASALENASKQARMVVVGSRGRGGFLGLLLGSTSRTLAQVSDAPLAVVRS